MHEGLHVTFAVVSKPAKQQRRRFRIKLSYRNMNSSSRNAIKPFHSARRIIKRRSVLPRDPFPRNAADSAICVSDKQRYGPSMKWSCFDGYVTRNDLIPPTFNNYTIGPLIKGSKTSRFLPHIRNRCVRNRRNAFQNATVCEVPFFKMGYPK